MNDPSSICSVQIVLIPVVIKTYVFTHYPDVL